MAQNMTVSTLSLSPNQDLLIYTSDGDLYGIYNTSSPLVALPPTDFMVVLRPSAISQDPIVILTGMLTWLTQNLVVVVFGLGAVFLLVRKW